MCIEHPRVFTLGRRGGRENLCVDDAFLAQKGVAVMPTDRGGNITYHGPGQLVVYPIVHLNRRRLKVVEFVSGLEQAMIRTAGRWGHRCRHRPGQPRRLAGGRQTGQRGHHRAARRQLSTAWPLTSTRTWNPSAGSTPAG